MNKILLFLSFFLVVSFSTVAQNRAVVMTTAHQVVLPETDDKVLFIDLKAEDIIETKFVHGSRVLIEAQIEIDGASPKLANFMAESKNYDLLIRRDKVGKLTICENSKKQVLIIKGNKCEQRMKYRIYIPKDMAYLTRDMNTMETASVD